ncbi:hypothetical protein Y032_0653g1174 [Ancylostoma ceylanicum]|nr:hypothetical protein Y032_0653g1174 [Ancylostoma ceylanicum]
MRICFDKGDNWCEQEGNALSLIFAHDVFIPTDSEQSIMFGIEFKQIHHLRINFLMDEPGILLEYAFTTDMIPGISHSMHLRSYEEVGMDPSKLKIHVIKERYCEGRILSVRTFRFI